MDFSLYKSSFEQVLGVKSAPNEREKMLFARARHFLLPLRFIPGVEMIAVGNSVSMYATHENSDIDLFIVVRPWYLWFVRVLVTCILAIQQVWRKGDAIAGNFCLSFFITTEAMNLEKIAIDRDIYLYYWIYFLKPIFIRGNLYEVFLRENNWVIVSVWQQKENTHDTKYFPEKKPLFDPLWKILNTTFRCILEWRTKRHNEKLWNPSWVIISETILKFHVDDRRVSYRDRVLSYDSGKKYPITKESAAFPVWIKF